MRSGLPLALALLCACHAGAPQQLPDGGPLPDGGHSLPGPGLAASWQIEDPAELIAGPSSAGRLGDWEMANSRIRVIIEGAHPSDGFDPYGCSAIAADRQRDGGGESRFGEIWMGLNFRAPGCDALQLVNDGSDENAFTAPAFWSTVMYRPGNMVPADMFDQVQKLLEEYRASAPRVQ
jgi:hypothetical protein